MKLIPSAHAWFHQWACDWQVCRARGVGVRGAARRGEETPDRRERSGRELQGVERWTPGGSEVCDYGSARLKRSTGSPRALWRNGKRRRSACTVYRELPSRKRRAERSRAMVDNSGSGKTQMVSLNVHNVINNAELLSCQSNTATHRIVGTERVRFWGFIITFVA